MHKMKDRKAEVVRNERVAADVMKMTLKFGDLPPIIGGQFAHVRLPDGAHVLRRPFCICDFDAEKKTVDLCYAVVGGGTRVLADVKEGEKLDVLLPLGNGYVPVGKKIMLIGGGMGSAVLPAVITAFPDREYSVFLGFSDASKVVLADEPESKGCEGHACHGQRERGSQGLRRRYSRSRRRRVRTRRDILLRARDSLQDIGEEICGFGCSRQDIARTAHGVRDRACLVCNCRVKRGDGEEYLRVCKDGPVFGLKEVVL